MEVITYVLENWLSIASIIAFFTLLLALLAIYVQIKTCNMQLSAQSYISYTQKYDSLIESIPGSYWEKKDEENFTFPVDNEALRKKLHGYFQLCCQQFYLQHNNFINDSIWKMWKREIAENLSQNSMRLFWDNNEKKYYKNYPEFEDFVKNVQDD
jgi:hypothetical protein